MPGLFFIYPIESTKVYFRSSNFKFEKKGLNYFRFLYVIASTGNVARAGMT